jgi:hypothetical protein
MSISYFSNFPKINYFNVLTTNITLRAAFIDKLKQDVSVFYPYVIQEGETADAISTWYYGRPDFDWLVYLANDIVDPHTQWPKSYLQLEDYIIKKYGSLQIARSNIEFYRKTPEVSYISVDGVNFNSTDTGSMQQVLYNTDIRITKDTYAIITDPINYSPVYSYDYELELNDAKKNITLINNKLKNRVATELSDLING